MSKVDALAALDELERLKRALSEYPLKNRQQLQARKVCAGVIELAASYAGESK